MENNLMFHPDRNFLDSKNKKKQKAGHFSIFIHYSPIEKNDVTQTNVLPYIEKLFRD